MIKQNDNDNDKAKTLGRKFKLTSVGKVDQKKHSNKTQRKNLCAKR